MSLNKHIGPGLALYQGEMILRESSGVEATFKKFSHSSEHLKGTKHGHLYLTNFRLLFVNGGKNDMMHELSVPFPNIKDFEIKQPLFGANYLQGRILAEPDGGWEGSAWFEMTFKSGGAIDIGQKLVELATRPPQMMYPASRATIIIQANQAISGYAVPGTQDAYCFPAATAPTGYPQQPPMYPPQPPAYPQQPPMYPTAQQPPLYPAAPNSGDSKAMEAAQSSLPPQYNTNQAPPKYDDIGKKDQ